MAPPDSISFEGKDVPCWTFAQLERVSKANLKQRALNLRDQIGADRLQPLRVASQPAGLIRWMLVAQSTICEAVGVPVTMTEWGAPNDDGDDREGELGAYFGGAAQISAVGRSGARPPPTPTAPPPFDVTVVSDEPYGRQTTMQVAAPKETGATSSAAAADDDDWQLDDDLAILLGESDDAPGKPLSWPSLSSPPWLIEDEAICVVDCSNAICPLDFEEFSRRFRHQQPVLLRGLARHWPALAQWGDATTLGSSLSDDNTVTCLYSGNDRRFLGRDCEKRTRSLSAVAEDVLGPNSATAERLYARAPLADGLRSAVDLSPIEALMGSGAPKPACCSVWLGPGGNVTPFHVRRPLVSPNPPFACVLGAARLDFGGRVSVSAQYDLCHGFLAGVVGVKAFTLVSPEDYRCMYPRPDRPELSRVDYEAMRLSETSEAGREERERRPRFEHATSLCVVHVHAGDVLYTPPFWWHHVETVEAHGPAVSVLVPFDPRDDESIHVCHMR